jgi:hypothetical protein
VLATLCKVCGFTFTEVTSLTMGQVVRYMRAIPTLMPLTNSFAKTPDKPLKGNAAVTALHALGLKSKKKVGDD